WLCAVTRLCHSESSRGLRPHQRWMEAFTCRAGTARRDPRRRAVPALRELFSELSTGGRTSDRAKARIRRVRLGGPLADAFRNYWTPKRVRQGGPYENVFGALR